MEGGEVRDDLCVGEGSIEEVTPSWVASCGAFVGCDCLRLSIMLVAIKGVRNVTGRTAYALKH